MRARAVGGVLAVLAFLTGCSAPRGTDPLSALERQAISDTIRGRMASYAAAVGSLDGTAILAHYVDSPDFRLYSDGQAYTYDDMRTLAGSLSQVLNASAILWDTVEVTVLGRDAAVAGAPFRRADTDKAGVVTRVRGTASWVWLRHGGEWRMIHGHGVHAPDTIPS